MVILKRCLNGDVTDVICAVEMAVAKPISKSLLKPQATFMPIRYI